MSEQPPETTHASPNDDHHRHPYFFYSIVNGFLIRLFFLLLFCLLGGIFLDHTFGTRPLFILLSIIASSGIIIYEGTKTFRQLLRDLEEYDKHFPTSPHTDKHTKRRILIHKIARQTVQEKYTHAERTRVPPSATKIPLTTLPTLPQQKKITLPPPPKEKKEHTPPTSTLPENKHVSPLVEQIRQVATEELEENQQQKK